MIAVALALAAEQVLAAPPAPLPPPHHFLHPLSGDCPHGATDEVVVCGAKEEAQRYRLQATEDRRYAEAPVRAEMRLGSGRLAAHNEDKLLGGGVHSKRAMITFSLLF